MAMSVASGRMWRRTSAVIPPTPGPYSTMTSARAQLIGCSSCLMRKRELGTIEPSMRGWRKKLRAKRRAFPFLVVGHAVWALFSTTTPARARSDRHSITIIARGHHSAGASPPLRASSAAGALRGEAQSAELRHEPLAMLALDLDDAVLDAAARAAKPLQPRRELGELRLIERQSADHRDRLATAAGNLTADHHARRARPRARRAVLRGT